MLGNTPSIPLRFSNNLTKNLTAQPAHRDHDQEPFWESFTCTLPEQKNIRATSDGVARIRS